MDNLAVSWPHETNEKQINQIISGSKVWKKTKQGMGGRGRGFHCAPEPWGQDLWDQKEQAKGRWGSQGSPRVRQQHVQRS